jgi:non-ribosomal peptide synthetase component F
MTADEIFLQSATISFDASTFEIWGSLLNGARLALMPPGCASLGELGKAIKQYQVQTISGDYALVNRRAVSSDG